MKMHAEVEEYLHEFLTPALDVGEWSASRFSRFASREQAPIPVRGEADWAPEPIRMQWQRGNPTPTLKITMVIESQQ
jgi:hypothetical protein